MDTRLYEEQEQQVGERSRGENYRLRRSNASRRRNRSGAKKPGSPGSIRQRRNRHWSW